MKKTTLLTLLCLGMLILPKAHARNYVSVAGSSTVLPFAAAAAEGFKRRYPNFKTPVVESGGSSAGLKLFCQGVGTDTIDVANASRRMKKKELETCHANGVQVIELSIGYDGIVFASDISVPPMDVTLRDLFLALAGKVPVNGELVDNPYTRWSDINPAYPDTKILAFIPGEKHGTRDVFETIVMGGGCRQVAGLKDLVGGDAKAFKSFCKRIRKDGVAVDIDGDYTVTLTRIQSNKGAMGVFGFSFYDQNRDRIQVATVEGQSPSFESISDGSWAIARPLYIYVKGQHLETITGLDEYTRFFMSDDVIGDDGIATDIGLIPAPQKERMRYRQQLQDKTDLQLSRRSSFLPRITLFVPRIGIVVIAVLLPKSALIGVGKDDFLNPLGTFPQI